MFEQARHTVEGLGFSTAFPQIRALCQRWREARHSDALPLFEDIAVGALGGMVDHTAIFRLDATGEISVSRLGERCRDTLGVSTPVQSLSSLGPNFSVPIGHAVLTALRGRTPVLTTARRISEGTVGVCECLTLPLQAQWGEELVFGYLRQREETLDLIGAVYRATADGLMALAAVEAEGGIPDFQIVSLNASAAALFGQPEASLCWTMLSRHLRTGRDMELLRRLASVLAEGAPQHFEFSLTSPGGRTSHVQISAAPVRDFLALAFTDVTPIREREASVRMLFDENPMPLLLCNAATLAVLQANAACQDLLGFDAEALASRSLFDLCPPPRQAALHAMLGGGARHTSEISFETQHLTAAGCVLDTVMYCRALPGSEPRLLGSIVDVTEKRKTEARIAHLAHHDALTGLLNRTLFHTRLSAALARFDARGSRPAVLCLDLDRFKHVNDTFGHAAGDALLVQVAARLTAICQGLGEVARLGGDEFAVLTPGMSREDAGALAARLLTAIGRPYQIEGQDLSVGISIGIALATRNTDPETLLKSADIALYQSKAEGRGSFVFFRPEMASILDEKRRLEAQLRDAIARCEFRLVYQPVIALPDRRVVAFEALLRWQQPERGLVSPLDFIPLAEELGLIVPIGNWVLRQACKEAASWPEHVRVAVNLSPLQLKSPGLVSTVLSALSHAGLSPRRLDLEITEAVLMAETRSTLDTLHRLRALGVTISIDDFGTGYSSLAYLRSFPIDRLKIDRSFVGGLRDDNGCRAIVRAVLGLAADLGITSLAEGVETTEQLAELVAQGCGEVQGYLFSPPVGPDAVRAMLAQPTGNALPMEGKAA